MKDSELHNSQEEQNDGPPLTPWRAAWFEKARDGGIGWAPWSARFWRGMVVAFCVASILGHWMEIPYCLFNRWAFGIVEDDSLVFTHPMYPFLVYGIAAVLCSLFLVPQRDWLIDHYKPRWRALIRFFLMCMLGSCAGELIMGLLLNQPDPVTGVYPLWDNSQLPGNVLGQAWLVNDFLLGAILTLYVWVIYPIIVKAVTSVPEKYGWPITIIIAVSFTILCIVEFSSQV